MIKTKILKRFQLHTEMPLKLLFKTYFEKLILEDEADKRDIISKVTPMTMTGELGVLANIDAVDYITKNSLKGAIVECGVWKGGSTAAMIYRLLQHKDKSRQIYLFDTFAGMTEPTEEDKKGSLDVVQKFEEHQTGTHNEWCYSPIEEVKSNIAETGYPEKNVHFIKGDVLQTIPQSPVDEIAILRLDTDWYESTKIELEHFYPKVVKGGVVIIDDYGAWQGARKATDEYFEKMKISPLMQRVDHTRRMFVKHD